MTSRAGIGPRRQPQQFRRLSDNLYEQEVIVDDDLTLYTSGRKSTGLRSAIYIILCVITGGIYYLICRWNTTIEMKTKTFPCSLADADYICIKNQWGEISLNRITKIDFGMKASMIFPRSFTEVDASQDIILDHLRFYEYRYFKFFFNPNTGMFEPNYAWVDSNWTSVSRVFLEQDDGEDILTQIRKFIASGQYLERIKWKSRKSRISGYWLMKYCIHSLYSKSPVSFCGH